MAGWLMLKSPIPCENPAMTKTEAKPVAEIVNELFSKSPDGLRELVRAVMQEMLEAEMTDALGAEKGERSAARLGYRSGYYSRTLITRVGKLELRVPQDRDGRFSTELFERYQRSEQALVATLAEMYVQGVSTRKVKAITEELCGHSFSASAISAINKLLWTKAFEAAAGRPLEGQPFAYLILDARYEKVREGGVVMSQAVLIAIGIDWDGRRQILAPGRNGQPRRSRSIVEGLPHRLAQTRPQRRRICRGRRSCRPALGGIREVLSDAALPALLRPLPAQRPRSPAARKADDDCLQGAALALRPPLGRRGPATTLPPGSPNGACVIRGSSSHMGREKRDRGDAHLLTGRRASIISISKAPTCWNALQRGRSGDEPMSCRSFPNADACRRLVRALAVETHENWLEAHRYLNMNDLKEHKKIQLRQAA